MFNVFKVLWHKQGSDSKQGDSQINIKFRIMRSALKGRVRITETEYRGWREWGGGLLSSSKGRTSLRRQYFS